MTELFPEDQEAKDLHGLGIHLATKELDFGAAHEAYAQSLEIVRAKRLEATSEEALSLSLQESRVIRDDAFVYTREAIKLYEPDLLITARENLFAARYITENMLDDNEIALTIAKKSFLLSEHGAAETFLGRTATVWTVMAGSEHLFDENGGTADSFYTEAIPYLRNGPNRYYETSNAINAARSARYNGNWARTFAWLGITAGSIVRAQNDPHNFRPALETVGSRLPHLATKFAARVSILAKP